MAIDVVNNTANTNTFASFNVSPIVLAQGTKTKRPQKNIDNKPKTNIKEKDNNPRSYKDYIKLYRNLSDKDKNKLKEDVNKLRKTLEALLGYLVSSVVGVGFLIFVYHSGVAFLQRQINGKLLGGYLDKKFMSLIPEKDKMLPLGDKMRKKYGLENKVRIFESRKNDEAYYSSSNNNIVISKNTRSAIFHELGHAIIENKTKFLRFLQQNRDNYANISLFLNSIIMMYNKQAADNKKVKKRVDKNSQISKTTNEKTNKINIQNKFSKLLSKYPYAIPILAFSPELITEAGASYYGMKFLKKELAQGNILKKTYKNIAKSYLTAFSTYLFIPVSIILVNLTSLGLKKVDKIKKSEKQSNKDNLLMAKTILTAPIFSGVVGKVMSNNVIIKNKQLTDKFLNDLVNFTYNERDKIPKALENELENYLRIIHVENLDIEKLLNSKVSDNVLLKDVLTINQEAQKYETVGQMVNTYKQILRESMNEFFDFNKGCLKPLSLIEKEDVGFYKHIKNLVNKNKRNYTFKFVKRASVFSVMSMYLYNEFKYLLFPKHYMGKCKTKLSKT